MSNEMKRAAKRGFQKFLIEAFQQIPLIGNMLADSVRVSMMKSENESNNLPGVSQMHIPRPNVIFADSEVVVGGMKWNGSAWEVRYGNRDNPTEHYLRLTTSTASGNVAVRGKGSVNYQVVWT